MKAFSVVVALVVGLVAAAWWHGPLQAQSGTAGGESKTVSFADATETPAAASDVTAGWAGGDMRATASGPRGFSIRAARRLGLTVPNMARAWADAKKSKAIGADSTDADAATEILLGVRGKNAAAWSSVEAAIPLDSILAWIEKMMPLILAFMKILGL